MSGRVVKGCEYTHLCLLINDTSSFLTSPVLENELEKKGFNDWVVNENKKAVLFWKLQIDMLEINNTKGENEIPEEHYFRLV